VRRKQIILFYQECEQGGVQWHICEHLTWKL